MSIIEKNLLESLTRALEDAGIEVGEPEFEVPYRGGQLDCLLPIASPYGRRRLAIELLRQAYPRDIRDAAWQLESFVKNKDAAKDIILMVAAEHLSDGAKDDLRHHRLAYFEASGTFYLRHKDWFIDIQRPSKPATRRSAVQLFTGAKEQVVLALLVERHNFRSGLELSKLSETSTYTVSTVLAELERREWIESEGSGRMLRRRLSKPTELLDAWAEAWTQRKETKTKWYCYVSNPSNMLEQFAKEIDESYTDGGIFTGPAAANRIAPNLTRTDTVDLIIPEGKSEFYAFALHLKQVSKGANVTLIERTGASTLFTCEKKKRTDPMLANPFILYLDLLDGKGRNKELAEQLRLQELGI
jgi:Transcriptional regulator, AbiEi antitoxin, Type IV TA system